MPDFDFKFYRGRVGLAGLLHAVGVGGGDEVITQAFTCVAVPEGIIAAGGTPMFVDLAEGSVNLDARHVEKKISKKTKAIIVQHTFGYAGPLEEIIKIARNRKIAVIEDCCHTYETTINGRQVGTIGDAAFYSLEWGKPLPCGVGGAAVANDVAIRERLKSWNDNLRDPSLAKSMRLELQYLAYSVLYRPSTYWPVKSLFHLLSRAGAAEGNFSDLSFDSISQDFGLRISSRVARRFERKFKSIAEVTRHSEEVVESYRMIDLSDGLSRVADDTAIGSVLARYPLWTNTKAQLLEAAKVANVELADWYKTPIHPLAGGQLEAVNYSVGDCPAAEEACKRIVSLPTNRGVSRRFISKVSQLLAQTHNVE